MPACYTLTHPPKRLRIVAAGHVHQGKTMSVRARVEPIRFCIATCLLLFAAAVFAGPSHTLDRIRADGVIHLGLSRRRRPVFLQGTRRQGARLQRRALHAYRLGHSETARACHAQSGMDRPRGGHADRFRGQGQGGYRMRHDDDVAGALRAGRLQPADLCRRWQRTYAHGRQAEPIRGSRRKACRR